MEYLQEKKFISDLKYGDFVKIFNTYFLVKNMEIKKEIIKITLKNMNTGKIKVELFTYDLLRKLNVEKINLKFIKQDDNYYYFQNENKEEIKYKITFIGTDFLYIIKKKNKEFIKYVEPVYINYCSNNIKKGTKISLKTNTDNAKIFYTLDGSIPDKDSKLFKKDLIIKKDCLLKAVAYKNGYKNSYVAEFPFYLKNRKIRIFLSPSRQKYNLGIKGSGYTSEMQEMNKLCDEIENILKKYDVILYRNSYETFIEDWSKINHEECIDLHLAIHSNGSYGHWKKGVENWIHDSYSSTYSLAKKIYDEVYSIYPANNDPLTNHGIKYANGFLAEANPAYFTFGMNLEVAYHDNLEDAKWLVSKRKDIAKAICKALIDYYQLERK